ncbi:MAG: type II toxin-antitoxin system VapC family toxin [Planctomycetota bacterium]
MIVPDASAVIEVLLRTDTGRALEDRLFAPEETLHAPELIDLEVVQVLRRLESRGELSARRAFLAIETFTDFRIVRYAHEPMLGRIWELRKNLTAYDAAYVALAEALDAPLLTCDGSLASAPGIRARIIVG